MMLLLGVRTQAVFLLDCPPDRASTESSEADLKPSSMEATLDDGCNWFQAVNLNAKNRKVRLTILISLANKTILMSSFISIGLERNTSLFVKDLNMIDRVTNACRTHSRRPGDHFKLALLAQSPKCKCSRLLFSPNI